MDKFVDYISSLSFILTIVYIALCIGALTFIKRFLIKKVAYTNKSETHKNTLLGVVFNILQYIILLLTIFLVLKANGVDVGTLFAGLGIVATIIGLSLQDTIKDIIMGVNIYNNNFYKVGDVILYEGILCEVKYFNARITKVKTLNDGCSFTFNNSSVSSIKKIKDNFALCLYFDFNTDKKLIDKAFTNMIPRIDDVHGISGADYWGMVALDNTGAKYGIGYNCSPKFSLIAQGRVATIAYEELNKFGISPSFEDEVKVQQMNPNKPVYKVPKTKTVSKIIKTKKKAK